MDATKKFTCTREIQIDAAHRVPDHRSKCQKLHGHRYVVRTTVEGQLHAGGEQKGMVIDFGFLKEMMMEHIHDPCDHGLILFVEDPLATELVQIPITPGAVTAKELQPHFEAYLKLYLMEEVPTAENLARHWYYRLMPSVLLASEEVKGHLKSVEVWETPNCFARYPV